MNPTVGPGTGPDVLRRWARAVEALGYGLLMVSDHIAVTPDMAERYRPMSAFAPRIALRLAGEGTIDQVIDRFDGDPRETRRPEAAWQALATVAAHWDLGASPTRPERRDLPT